MHTRSTRHLVDPGILPLVDTFPAFDLTSEILPLLRQGFGARVAVEEDPGARAGVETSVRAIPGRVGDPAVRIIVHRPRERATPSGAILHIHGGGYITGDAQSFAPVHRAMALALGCVIVSVDYRLAPETRAPGQVEDCYAALAWLVDEAGGLGIDRARIGVMGESAGGGLAAALALLTRDRREHDLAFQHLIYPMLDDRTGLEEEANLYAGEFVWTRKHNVFGWASLLGVEPGETGVSPYAAPARATDLAGLPPTYIAVGALDLFIDEDLDFAHRLIRVGVPTEIHVYPGACHGFHFSRAAAVTVQANADSAAALSIALSPR